MPRHADARRPACHLLRQQVDPLQLRGAAGEHDPRRHDVVVHRALHLGRHHLEDLLHARLHDLAEPSPQLRLGAFGTERVDRDLLGRIDHARDRMPPLPLRVFRRLVRRAQAHDDVARHMVAADRQHSRVVHAAFDVERDVRRAAADVREHDALLLLLFVEHRLRTRQRFEDQVLDRAVDAGDDVRLDVEARAEHADGIRDVVLAIDDVIARDDVDDFAVRRDADDARAIEDARHVVRHDGARAVRDRDDAAIVKARDMLPGDANVRRMDARAARPFRLLDGGANRLRGVADVLDHPARQSLRRRYADTEDPHVFIARHLAHDRAHLRGADVDRSERSPTAHVALRSS